MPALVTDDDAPALIRDVPAWTEDEPLDETLERPEERNALDRPPFVTLGRPPEEEEEEVLDLPVFTRDKDPPEFDRPLPEVTKRDLPEL